MSGPKSWGTLALACNVSVVDTEKSNGSCARQYGPRLRSHGSHTANYLLFGFANLSYHPTVYILAFQCSGA